MVQTNLSFLFSSLRSLAQEFISWSRGVGICDRWMLIIIFWWCLHRPLNNFTFQSGFNCLVLKKTTTKNKSKHEALQKLLCFITLHWKIFFCIHSPATLPHLFYLLMQYPVRQSHGSNSKNLGKDMVRMPCLSSRWASEEWMKWLWTWHVW